MIPSLAEKRYMNTLVTNIQGFSIHDGPGIRTVVFFKGCGLECRWCSNPECISNLPEVGLVKRLCAQCGKCAEICPTGALVTDEDGFPSINRKLCTGCGECSEVCIYDAIIHYGKPMSVEEIYDIVYRDKMFYDSSGGGVTVSGGEALLHPELVRDLFRKCRDNDVHTCIETSGYIPTSSIQQVLPYTDYFLFDLKHLDSEKHLHYTGKPNELILTNAEMVNESRAEVLFRMPLIPGINDDVQNIQDTASFLHSLGNNACRIELMPYHRLGKGKYESLDKEYILGDISVHEPKQIKEVKTAFENFGITCLISK
jgi:pyruvate formate lyase activating enzyme